MKYPIKSIPGHDDENTAYHVVTMRIKVNLAENVAI